MTDQHLLRKRFVAFLYDLMRDAVPCGEVERIVQEALKVDEMPEYTNRHLAGYALSIVERLESFEPETKP